MHFSRETGINSLEPQHDDSVLKSRTHPFVLCEYPVVPKPNGFTRTTKRICKGLMQLNVESGVGLARLETDVVDKQEVRALLLNAVVFLKVREDPCGAGGHGVDVVGEGLGKEAGDKDHKLCEFGISVCKEVVQLALAVPIRVIGGRLAVAQGDGVRVGVCKDKQARGIALQS